MMNTINEKIAEFGVVPVVVLEDAKDARPLAEALVKGGLPCAEVTFRTEAAEESIRSGRKYSSDIRNISGYAGRRRDGAYGRPGRPGCGRRS